MLVASKICSAALLAVLRLSAGLLPLKVYHKLEEWCQSDEGQSGARRRKLIDRCLSIFLCFGAGLLLSTCFIHMMPEVKTSFEEASKVGDWPIFSEYPFAEIVICAGFFAVYLLEELGKRLVTKNDHEPLEKKTGRNLKESSKCQPLLGSGNQAVRSNYQTHDHHGHSHGPTLNNQEQSSIAAAIRGFLLVAALSFHSIFDGMAIGLQPTLSDVWFLFTAVIFHEFAITFCIGMEMLASNLRIFFYVAYMVELGLVTSVGVGAGIIVTEYTQDPSATHMLVIAILQGIAAGTILYVTFLEVLERERQKSGNGLEKLFSTMTGFFTLTMMEALSRMHSNERESLLDDAAIRSAAALQNTEAIVP